MRRIVADGIVWDGWYVVTAPRRYCERSSKSVLFLLDAKVDLLLMLLDDDVERVNVRSVLVGLSCSFRALAPRATPSPPRGTVAREA